MESIDGYTKIFLIREMLEVKKCWLPWSLADFEFAAQIRQENIIKQVKDLQEFFRLIKDQ